MAESEALSHLSHGGLEEGFWLTSTAPWWSSIKRDARSPEISCRGARLLEDILINGKYPLT